MELNLTCKTFISVNHYMSYRVVGRRVHLYKPKTTKDFEKEFGTYVESEIKKQGWVKPPKNKLVIMEAIFYFPRIDMDTQNYFKSLSDIMTSSGVWEDDNVVMEKVERIYYDKKNPRIELKIYPSEFVGIFNNKEEYNEFVSKCVKCKRYKRNCSILKKALEGRIQDEIVRNKCLKY